MRALNRNETSVECTSAPIHNYRHNPHNFYNISRLFLSRPRLKRSIGFFVGQKTFTYIFSNHLPFPCNSDNMLVQPMEIFPFPVFSEVGSVARTVVNENQSNIKLQNFSLSRRILSQNRVPLCVVRVFALNHSI